MTPGKLEGSASRDKRYCTRSTVPQVVEPAFRKVKRATLMGMIFASGHIGKPLFVLEGTKLRYRVLQANGTTMTEAVVEMLLRNALVTTREDLGGVDSQSFARWAKMFVEEGKDLTVDGRKELLIYNGYPSHMTLASLEILDAGGVIAYALPSHTSGTTQPLELAVFGPWK